MATTTSPMTVAAFLEQYPNAAEIFAMAQTQTPAVAPALVDYDSDPDSDTESSGSESEVEEHQTFLKDVY